MEKKSTLYKVNREPIILYWPELGFICGRGTAKDWKPGGKGNLLLKKLHQDSQVRK